MRVSGTSRSARVRQPGRDRRTAVGPRVAERLHPVVRSALFSASRADPEQAHLLIMRVLEVLDAHPQSSGRLLRSLAARPSEVAQEVLGLKFDGVVGLAAGFDKHAEALGPLRALFDFVEVGAVLPEAQAGNLRPRIRRVPGERALLNRMGFNSDGVAQVKARLAGRPQVVGRPVGVNVGKMRGTSDADAWRDYTQVITQLSAVADYFAINVSSPNTPGLRRLQRADELARLVTAARDAAHAAARQNNAIPRPVLAKLSPDLEPGALEASLDAIRRAGGDGVVFGNTSTRFASTDRHGAFAAAGYSGPALLPGTLDGIRQARQTLGPDLAVIACGGVTNGADALAAIRAGADLIQIYTAFVYDGPATAWRINLDLASEIRRLGARNVRELREAAPH